MNDVSDQTKVEMFKQVVEKNNCSPNTISICLRIKDERKLHKKDWLECQINLTKFSYND